ncbi:MAG: TonB-dependent receptor [Tenuifilaceae bacterium]|nr:TonB-dependent receptor [Tenuifilaceae bacterium]
MRKLHYTTLIVILLLPSIFSAFSQERDSLTLLDYSLDDLMQLKIESAAKRSEAIAEIPASIVIISRKDIERQGWQTLEEVLCNVPGMYLINDYLWFGTDNFGVRGFFSSGSFSNMIILVNGISQKEDWYNSFPLTKVNVPVDAIDRIEVIRGPMSVVYGSNAFLGAINIVTNQSDGTSMVALGGGTNGNYKVFGRITGGNGNLKFNVNLSGFGSDGIGTPYSSMTDNINEDWSLPNNPKSDGQLEDHRIYIDSWFNYEDFYFGFQQTHTNRGVIDYYPGYKDGHLAQIQSTNSFVGYRKNLIDNFSLQAEVGYYSFRDLLDYKHNSDTTAYGFNDIFSDAIDAELNLNANINSKWNISFGTYYRRILRDKLVVDAPNISDDYVNLNAGLSRDNRIQTWGIYFQSTYSITSKLDALIGARIEQTPSYTINYAVRFDPSSTYQYLAREGVYQYGKPYFIPRAALILHLTDGHHMKFMFGQAIKRASIGENMDIVRYPERDQLKPANMQTLELNYYGLLSHSAIFNVSLFHNYAKNLISRTNQLEDGVMRLFNTNSGKLVTLGVEASVQYKPTSKLSTSLSLVAQKSENLQTGYENITLEYAPSILAYGMVSYQLTQNISIGFSGFCVGAMETYWRPDTRNASDMTDNRTPIQLIADGKRIGDKATGYTVINGNLRFNNLLKKNFYCALHIHNVLNTEVRYPTTRSNDIFEKGTIGYGRYITLSVGKVFSNKE